MPRHPGGVRMDEEPGWKEPKGPRGGEPGTGGDGKAMVVWEG